ncbi:MAG: branched-chain amino acid ABC transporter permease [Anaerolineae bacterium]
MANILKDPRRLPSLMATAAVIVIALVWLGPLVASSAPNRLLQSAITGLLVGGIYSLIALGIVVINKASGVFNFAHGGMMMVTGFIFFSFFTSSNVSLPFAVIFSTVTVLLAVTMLGWRELLRQPRLMVIGLLAIAALAFVISLPGTDFKWLRGIVGASMGAALLGLTVERFTIRPLIGQPLFASVMMTLAVAQIFNGTTQLLWGSQPQALLIFAETNPIGLEVKVSPIRIDATELLGGNISIDRARLYAFGLALVAFLAFWVFFRYTSVGLAMRATSENQMLAQSVGLRVRMILAVAWGIAALLAGTAGVLHGGAASLDTNMQLLALRAFPAVLLGGIESIGGALIGGLAIGLTEEYSKLLFSGDVGEQLAPYVVLMVVLVFRPEGLFGQKRIDRI